MKRIFMGLFLAVVFSGVALAGMNLRQDADSGATWVHGPSGNTYSVGREILHARIADISTASTEYVYVTQTGYVTEVHCTMQNAITAADAVIAVARQDNPGVAAGAAFAEMTISSTGASAGDVDSSTGLSTSVAAGYVLEVGTNGVSSTASAANCLIYIDTNE